jgi:hypothetical protein
MANTTNVQITTPNVWTVAQAGPFTGVMSIAGNGQWCISSAGAPAETLIGHRFTGELVGVEVTTETLYVKADTQTTVILT